MRCPRTRYKCKVCINVLHLPSLGAINATRASDNSAAPPTATATEHHPDEVSTVPTHWTEHLSHLRPGERRALKRYFPLVSRINALESEMKALSDSGLAALTAIFRSRLASGESLESVMAEAFAAVREASYRVLGLRHFDVQLLGGAILAEGHVAEMSTGEGKTLVASLPAYLFALTGRGVHVVTVNDYLAQRDAEWVGKVLRFMDLSVGVVTGETPPGARTSQFEADVTYVTAYELAFTFLHDNLAPSARSVSLRRPLHFAVVDEVDSILIDEARNPFLINAPDSDSDAANAWIVAVAVARQLNGTPTGGSERMDLAFLDLDKEDLVASELFDFIADPRYKSATMTPRGMLHAVRALASARQLLLATSVSPPVTSNSENGGGATHHANDLYAVLLWPTEDSRVLLDVRPVLVPTRGDTLQPPAVPHRSSIIYDDSPEFLESALRGLGISEIPFHTISTAQWRSAAPAILWTGGGRAWGRFILQAIRAVHVYRKDVDYILRKGEVVIIDAATGRERERSRWQAGLHQALEAKETSSDPSIQVKPEDYDRGRVTYQSLFREYEKLSGMTGTAATEAEEFGEAYELTVVRVPPHRPSRRVDHPAVVYGGQAGWERRLKEIVRAAAASGRPMLLGTSSVEESEKVVGVVSGMLFEAELSSQEVDRLNVALTALPRQLPSPPDVPNHDALSAEQRESLEFYSMLRDEYEGALSVLHRAVHSRRLGPYDVDAAQDATCHLSYLTGADRLLLPREEEAVTVVVSVLRQVLDRSTLGQRAPINLLNARPDRARKEAETIAQAGLPGTITVATAMAGRGTDILLGGNPKGLTLMALKYFFLKALVPDASDVPDWAGDRPLAGLHHAFSSEADLDLHLPRPISAAFKEAKKAAAEIAATGGGVGFGGSRSSSLPPSSARDAVSLLSAIVESVESDRSHFLLSTRRMNVVATPEGALAWTQNQEREDGPEGWADVPLVERSLRRYALLQWLWFDRICEEYAVQVRAAGGLVVVISSVPETRRSEAQLRGRAGRQGDPGETFFISSREDPAISALLLPSRYQSIWKFVDESGGGLEPIPSPIDKALIKQLMQSAEQMQQSGRDVTRKYDAIIDPYRRHVYRLRRTMAGGGDAARAALIHRYLRSLAADLVTLHVVHTSAGGAPPRQWRVQLQHLLEAVESLAAPQISSIESFGDTFRETHPRGGAPGGVAFQESGDFMHISLNLDAENVALALTDALAHNMPLPPAGPRVMPALPAPLPLTRRAAWQDARRDAQDQMARSSNAQKRHAAETQRLQLWIGDLLAWMYEYKRSAVLGATRRRLFACTALQADGIMRLWERDALLECIDALWSDFLQDSAILQRAAQSRAFSMLDPVDEYRLEASGAFARLLTDFRRQAAVVALGAVDAQRLHGLHAMASDVPASTARSVLRDVEWAAALIETGGIMEEGCGASDMSGSIHGEDGSVGGPRDALIDEHPPPKTGILEVGGSLESSEENQHQSKLSSSPEDSGSPGERTERNSDDAFDAVLGQIAGRLLSASPEELRAAMEEVAKRRANNSEG